MENLTLTGSAAINGTGNALNNTLTGNNGANVLSGLAGLDTLVGGTGNDQLSGGAGNDSLGGGGGVDRFVFDTALGSSNVDRLTDFVRGTDKLVLDDDIFTKLGTGTAAGKAIASGSYKVGTKATDANDYLVYDPATDKLFYDRDGSGANTAMPIATIVLTGTAAPALADFMLVT